MSSDSDSDSFADFSMSSDSDSDSFADFNSSDSGNDTSELPSFGRIFRTEDELVKYAQD
jgi:hypothetical protein